MVQIIASLLVILLALKLAEGTGGLEFDGAGSVFVVALICGFGGWGANSVLALLLPDPQSPTSLVHGLSLMFGRGLITTTFCLLVAWAIVPGAHIRRFSGLILAAILIVGFRFAATLLIGRMLVVS